MQDEFDWRNGWNKDHILVSELIKAVSVGLPFCALVILASWMSMPEWVR